MKILGAPTVSLEQLQKKLNFHELFVTEILPPLYKASLQFGLDPLGVVAQSLKETGFGTFKRAVLPTFFNPCGLKIRDPKLAGDQESTLAHAQFANWEVGALAHVEHIYAYLQKPIPVGVLNVDPRWVWVFNNPLLVKPVVHWRDMGGGIWAPSPTYGAEIEALAETLLP